MPCHLHPQLTSVSLEVLQLSSLIIIIIIIVIIIGHLAGEGHRIVAPCSWQMAHLPKALNGTVRVISKLVEPLVWWTTRQALPWSVNSTTWCADMKTKSFIHNGWRHHPLTEIIFIHRQQRCCDCYSQWLMNQYQKQHPYNTPSIRSSVVDEGQDTGRVQCFVSFSALTPLVGWPGRLVGR